MLLIFFEKYEIKDYFSSNSAINIFYIGLCINPTIVSVNI